MHSGQQRHSGGNRERIIAAASRLIMEKGIESTSLADIAQDVGISKGTLYYHYASKGELIFDIAESHINQVTEELLCWIEQVQQEVSPEEIFRMVFEKIIAATTRGKLHLYLIQEAITNDDALMLRFREKYANWQRLIEENLAKILHAEVDCRVFAQVILAALDGFIIQSLLGVEGLSLEEISRFVLGGT